MLSCGILVMAYYLWHISYGAHTYAQLWHVCRYGVRYTLEVDAVVPAWTQKEIWGSRHQITNEVLPTSLKVEPSTGLDSISASPTACPLRGYGRVGTQNDRLSDMSSAMPR